jgi:hypothetical protein
METIKNFLWPIVAIGGLGAFVDFLIGKTGQERAKDFLIRWWVRFDDVRWRNFGREEGLFAGQLIERWFGKRVWSVNRVTAGFAVSGLFQIMGYQKYLSISHLALWRLNNQFSFEAMQFITLWIGFCVSMSFTKFITFRVANLCDIGEVRNLFIFIGMLTVNYLMLKFWSPVTETLRDLIIELISAPAKSRPWSNSISGLLSEFLFFL